MPTRVALLRRRPARPPRSIADHPSLALVLFTTFYGQVLRPPACRVLAPAPLASGPGSDSVSGMTVTVPECTESVAAVLPLGASIASVGISLPDAIVPNAQIAPRIGVTDEWIVRRTGIRARHVAAP